MRKHEVRSLGISANAPVLEIYDEMKNIRADICWDTSRDASQALPTPNPLPPQFSWKAKLHKNVLIPRIENILKI